MSIDASGDPPKRGESAQEKLNTELNDTLLRTALSSHPLVSREYQVAAASNSPAAGELVLEHNRHAGLYALAMGFTAQQAKEVLSQHALILSAEREQAERMWFQLLGRPDFNVDMAAQQARNTAWLFAYANAAFVSKDQAVVWLRLLAASQL